MVVIDNVLIPLLVTILGGLIVYWFIEYDKYKKSENKEKATMAQQWVNHLTKTIRKVDFNKSTIVLKKEKEEK